MTRSCSVIISTDRTKETSCSAARYKFVRNPKSELLAVRMTYGRIVLLDSPNAFMSYFIFYLCVCCVSSRLTAVILLYKFPLLNVIPLIVPLGLFAPHLCKSSPRLKRERN